MGWIQDLLKDVPISAVMKERLALAEDKYNLVADENKRLQERIGSLEKENAELRAQLPQKHDGSLGEDTTRVLVHLFTTSNGDALHVYAMAKALGMEQGIVQYHLDRLHEARWQAVTATTRTDVYIGGYGLKGAGTLSSAS